ncbi:4Fe-4S dicluster domain-containing protein [Pseudoneobacillus sp. C159]
MTEELNRRGYLKLNWKGSIGFLSQALAPQFEQEKECFRPPGAGTELDFLTSCTRCGKCKDVCPEGIIKLFPSQAGAKMMNTPYLDPNQSPCSFCLECIDSCPTDALLLSHYTTNPPIGKAKIRLNACIAYQNVMCDYCVRACPAEGVMKLVNGKPVVDEEYCIGCGACVSQCITDFKGIWVHLDY